MRRSVGCYARLNWAALARICGANCGLLIHCVIAICPNRRSHEACPDLVGSCLVFPEGKPRVAEASISILVREWPEIPAGKVLHAWSRAEMARETPIEERRLGGHSHRPVHSRVARRQQASPRSGEVVVTAKPNEVRIRLAGRFAGASHGYGSRLSFDERPQDRQGEVGMPGFERLIEPIGKFSLARERAVPFPAVVSDAADLPERQLHFQQRQRSVDPGASIHTLFQM